MKKCIDCNKEEVFERKRCKECARKYNRERVKKYYKKDKSRYGSAICIVCGLPFIKGRKDQVAHGKCKSLINNSIDYNKIPRSKKANMIARQIIIDLGFVLDSSIIIHHKDENPNNNVLNNFFIMSNSNHVKLHAFLRKQRSLLMKVNSSNLENCWNILRDQLTTTWLEIAGVNVIKITDIGQSAAEPLIGSNIYCFSIEEGSETMYQTPKSNDMVKI